MTIANKRRFIRELCNRVRDAATAMTGKMPDEWDGHELRVYLAEKFDESRSMSLIAKDGRSKRAMSYRNEVLVRNL